MTAGPALTMSEAAWQTLKREILQREAAPPRPSSDMDEQRWKLNPSPPAIVLVA